MPLNDYEVDLDFTGDTPDDLEGQTVIPPGKYHVVITAAKRSEGAEEAPHLRVKYQVVAGTVATAVGVSAAERFYLSPDAKKRLKILAHRLGLVHENDFGQNRNVSFAPARGRELVVEIINEDFETKKGKMMTSSKWTFAGFWPPEDARVAGVPLNPQRAAEIRQALGVGGGTGAGQGPAKPRQTTIPGVGNGQGAYDEI